MGSGWLVTDGDSYHRVPIDGGPPTTVTDDIGGGAGWGPNDTIVTGSSTGGLWVRTAAGGDLQPLIEPPDDVTSYHRPRFLPNGRAVVFHTYNPRDTMQVALYDFETGQEQVLFRGDTPHYVTSGHLVFSRDDFLWAVSVRCRSPRRDG